MLFLAEQGDVLRDWLTNLQIGRGFKTNKSALDAANIMLCSIKTAPKTEEDDTIQKKNDFLAKYLTKLASTNSPRKVDSVQAELIKDIMYPMLGEHVPKRAKLNEVGADVKESIESVAKQDNDGVAITEVGLEMETHTQLEGKDKDKSEETEIVPEAESRGEKSTEAGDDVGEGDEGKQQMLEKREAEIHASK